MAIRILQGDCRDVLKTLEPDSIDAVVTSPPYWGLRSYLPADHPDKGRELGLEPTLGEHLEALVGVFREVRRVMKPQGTRWLNYGDCYATTPNGRSAAATKATGNDDRTFRDKPFSTIGPIYVSDPRNEDRRGNHSTLEGSAPPNTPGRIAAGGTLKAKDLCMIPNRLAIALHDDGWWVRSEIVWGKPNPMPDSSGKYRPSTAHEKIFLLTKSGKSFYDAEAVALPCSPNTHSRLAQNVEAQIGSARANGGRKTNGNMKAVARKQDGHGRRHDGFSERYFGKVKDNESMNSALAIMPETRYLRNFEPAPLATWTMSTQPFADAHFATFPPELVERCIKAGCPVGGVVLDPFGGAGTTGLVADRLQRDAVLIDLSTDYVKMARKRIVGDSPLFVEAAE